MKVVMYMDYIQKVNNFYMKYLGARWDYKKHMLNHSLPKELFSDLPIMQLIPVANRVVPTEGIYDCPMYKAVSRKGTLSTTGK